MKMIKKENCEYKSGYIVSGDEVVCIDNEVVALLNRLDIDAQRARFDRENKVEAHEYKCFTPKSEHHVEVMAGVETPKLDKFAEEALELMEEIDQLNNAEKVNIYLRGLGPVLSFIDEDYVLAIDQPKQLRFDLPTIGNPLELDFEKLSEIVVEMIDG